MVQWVAIRRPAPPARKAGVPVPDTTDERKYVVQNLERAMRILFDLAGRGEPRTLEELASDHDVSKASLLRILRTLELEGVVLREGDAYQLGPRVLDLSHGYLANLELDQVARPAMRRLAEATDQTVSLAMLDGLDVVYIGIEKARRELGIQGQIGGRHPANATALGKVMLADLDEGDLRRRLDGAELPRLTHRTLADPEALRAHLERVREQGYALDDEERGIGIRCVAAPIRDAEGDVVAGISVAGAIFHMTDETVTEYRDLVLEAAERISRRLGFDPDRRASRPGDADESDADATDAAEPREATAAD
jgi:IclR family acetate operon transcriptional repressor